MVRSRLAQCRWLAVRIGNLPGYQFSQAGAAGAIAAAVWQYNPLTQGGVEDGLLRFDREGMSRGFNFDLIRHEMAKTYENGQALSLIWHAR